MKVINFGKNVKLYANVEHETTQNIGLVELIVIILTKSTVNFVMLILTQTHILSIESITSKR